MKRKIVQINEDKCNGCGLCVTACHEGALKIINGKARLVSDTYCDGLGDCLPACPTDAIEIVERESLPFDLEAVKKNMEKNKVCSCPSSSLKTMNNNRPNETHTQVKMDSQLKQWPCQIRLVPANAPFFNDARLLIAADCAAYAYADMHNKFMKDKITLIGCPKLDDIDYADKLTDILSYNNIKSVTLVKMQVPCCNGLANALRQAMLNSKKLIPWNIYTISTDGQVIED